ncbi:MAG: cyclic nucleotide-binding domain-containing protein, partial [Vicinamibacteria bacterium]|nr:cyclic nucleotide-binding domain-containing protein [Vicinamibacteria bacterium]
METLSLEGSQSQTFIKPLSECHLFRALKSEHFPQILKIGELLRFDPDEVILRQGDPSDSFLVVVQGEASVRIKNSAGEEVEVGRVPLPSSVGEIGLLLNEPRTASVIALTDVQAIRFNAKAFEAMFQKIPNFGVGLAGGLAYRLQQVSGKVPLPQYDLKKGAPNAETLALLPIEMIQRHRALPLSVSGNALTLGLVDDPSSALLNAVHELLPSMELRTVKIDAKSFDEVLHAHSGIKGWRTAAAPAAAAAAPRSPRLDQMLERMVAEGASDLHLAAGHKPIWRIDGDIRAIEDAPILGPTEVLDLLAPVMESRHSEQFQNDSDTDFAYSLPGVARFRVNLYRDR